MYYNCSKIQQLRLKLDTIVNVGKNYRVDLYRAIFTNTFNGPYKPTDIKSLGIYREIIWIDRNLSKYNNKIVPSYSLANTLVARLGL